MNASPRDVFRPVLAVSLFVLLIGLSWRVLSPFLPAIVWATMIVVATWAPMLALQRNLGGRRWLAVTGMTLALVLVFVVPLSLAIGTIVAHREPILDWVQSLEHRSWGAAPAWLAALPLVGEWLAEVWQEQVAQGDFGTRIAPHLRALLTWFTGQVGSVVALGAQCFLTIVISALLYARGETAVAGLIRFMRRVGPRGEASVRLAGQAIRGVALGVVVTALVQAVLGGLGLAAVGVPFAAVLTALMFLLAVAQIGVVPVLACAVIWVYVQGDTGWGTALLVWTVFVGVIDNVLRPILIRWGADLPLPLIFAGVIGGLIAFGFVGIFLGPMVLAVTYTGLAAWTKEGAEEERPESSEQEERTTPAS